MWNRNAGRAAHTPVGKAFSRGGGGGGGAAITLLVCSAFVQLYADDWLLLKVNRTTAGPDCTKWTRRRAERRWWWRSMRFI
jgi:hypothetical protein